VVLKFRDNYYEKIFYYAFKFRDKSSRRYELLHNNAGHQLDVINIYAIVIWLWRYLQKKDL
jgi:hypothetical protein